MFYTEKGNLPIEICQVHGRTWGLHPKQTSNAFYTKEGALIAKARYEESGFCDASGSCRIDRFLLAENGLYYIDGDNSGRGIVPPSMIYEE